MRKKNPAFIFLSCLMAVTMLMSGCDGILPGGTPLSSASVTESPEASPTDSPATPADTAPASETPSEATASPTPTASPTEQPTPTPTPTPSPTESPTPEPTAPPTPVPTAHPGDRKDVSVQKYFESALPDGLTKALKYTKYAASLDYFVVMKSNAIRELPNAKSKALLKVKLANRFPMLAQVKGADGKVWYRVNAGNKGIGYIPASAGKPCFFQVSQVLQKLTVLKEIADQTGTVRVSNYKNRAGKPPQLPGKKEVDKYGNRRDQAAPAYLAPDKTASFCYMPDGTLGQMLDTKGDFIEIYFPGIDEVRFVPKKYMSTKKEAVSSLTQAIVVDRKYQNIMTLEYKDGAWVIASMCYVSTGKNSGYSLPTPLGFFAAIEKKKLGKYKLGEFWYLADGADPNAEDLKFTGYAPYAIRFTGGAYLHGLPKSVSYDPITNEIIMPENLTTEAHSCLGTAPQSHMCVRNYTSHAQYMYNWVKIGQAAVIVIE